MPFRLIGQSVWVRACGSTIDILHDNERCATHKRKGPRRTTREAHLPEGRRDFRHRTREYWQDRDDGISLAVGDHIREILEGDDAFGPLRSEKAIDGKLTFVEFLYRLLQDEVERRDVKKLTRLLKKANFEAHKTLEDFEFSFNPDIPREKIIQLGTCS